MITLHQKICGNVEENVRLYWLPCLFILENNFNIGNVIPKLQECVYNNSVFMVYRALYNMQAEKKSIRHYVKTQKSDGVVEREDPMYNGVLNLYRRERKLNRETFRKAFGEDFEQLTEPFIKYEEEQSETKVKRTHGQELTENQFEALENLRTFKIFEAISKNRLHDVKKISYAKFQMEYFPEINGKDGDLYEHIISQKHVVSPNFFKCLHLFELEVALSFEKNYLIAKAVKRINNKEERKKEISILTQSNFFVGSFDNKVIGHMVLGCKEILGLYNSKAINAENAVTLFCVCNEVMNASVCRTLDELLTRNPEIEFVVSEKAENFFEEYIAQGQHINEKDLNEINVMDFRKLFKKEV